MSDSRAVEASLEGVGLAGSRAYGVSPDGKHVAGGVGIKGFVWSAGAAEQLRCTGASIPYDPCNPDSFLVPSLTCTAFDVGDDGGPIVGQVCNADLDPGLTWTYDEVCQPARLRRRLFPPIAHPGDPYCGPDGAVENWMGAWTGVSRDGDRMVGWNWIVFAGDGFDPFSENGRRIGGASEVVDSWGFTTYENAARPVGVSSNGRWEVYTRPDMLCTPFGGSCVSGGSVRRGPDGELVIPMDEVSGVSLTGVVVVGADAGVAHRWKNGMVESLGDLAGGADESFAAKVSDAGHVIVGWGTSASGHEAVVWTQADGMQRLHDALVAHGVDLTGWTLREAHDVSADGQVIVGWGLHGGSEEGFVATLPLAQASPFVASVPSLGRLGLALLAGLLVSVAVFARRTAR